VAGGGVDIPESQPYPRMPAPPPEDEPAEETGNAEEPAAPREFPSHLLERGSVFRRRHRLYGPIVLYGGRIDPGKGCEELLHYFGGFLKEGGGATPALLGAQLSPPPPGPAGPVARLPA